MATVPPVDLSEVVRRRIRGLRQARGWSLDSLAARCHLSPSTLSRLETGNRRIDLDQLVALAQALGTTIDHLVEPVDDADVIIRPVRHQEAGLTTWVLSRDAARQGGRLVAKMRITPERRTGPGHLAVHPGWEWFTVLDGTAVLHLGERRMTVGTGEAAEFSTMIPHSVGALGGPVEILTMFDQDGERAHAGSAGETSGS
ncbi:helix-turn-helix domain-containing protein [Amycolatopsis alkalitolerans]|uniref:Helix-turn-helix domain-containing protein n=1 Tax=Amycolatopsis alkalitolerans TaxID=2547244 RepID=A0A5C4LVP9_9PSEU|nr:helix-turn-helix domain-containing protein [Amycolatopsis alkalitolerans]TNC23425.1 helix-turn-helix domain-containing protein [Amycolatopsis alkalitolerans]